MQTDSNIQAMEVSLNCRRHCSSGRLMHLSQGNDPEDCMGEYFMKVLKEGLLSAYARMACKQGYTV